MSVQQINDITSPSRFQIELTEEQKYNTALAQALLEHVTSLNIIMNNADGDVALYNEKPASHNLRIQSPERGFVEYLEDGGYALYTRDDTFFAYVVASSLEESRQEERAQAINEFFNSPEEKIADCYVCTQVLETKFDGVSGYFFGFDEEDSELPYCGAYFTIIGEYNVLIQRYSADKAECSEQVLRAQLQNHVQIA